MSDKARHPARVEARFYGRVQGVGFRWQVSKVARSFRCTGYVCNKLDGPVEVMIEGDRDEAFEFLEQISKSMKGYWHDRVVDERMGPPHFQSFCIKQ